MSDDRPMRAMEADLQLITQYLNHQLSEDQAKTVQKRIDTDPAFVDLVGPVVWAMRVPRKPRPAGEWDAHWEQFTKRAGFAYQKKKVRRRRLWIAAIVALTIAVPLVLARDAIRREIADRRDFESVPFDTGWIRLRNGALVQLEPGAALRTQKALRGREAFQVKLAGGARFQVPTAPGGGLSNLQPTIIATRAAEVVIAMGGEVHVHAGGDTTTVEVPRRVRRTEADFTTFGTLVYLNNDYTSAPLRLNERERGRAVRGRAPEKLP